MRAACTRASSGCVASTSSSARSCRSWERSLPREIVEELETLQDDVPSQSYRKIRKTFVASFGKPPDQVFTTFSHEPIAAASLGQVHEARNESRRQARVKVLYPRVATIIKVDLRCSIWGDPRLQELRAGAADRARAPSNSARCSRERTDLVNEAAMIARMSKNFTNDPDVLFPKVYPAWSSRTVMTMTFMDGVKDLEARRTEDARARSV